jgi:hypothetical protein
MKRPAAALLLLLALVTASAALPEPGARELIDAALARMGGAGRLRDVQRIRLEMMTQWQRASFDPRPYTDQPSYERHTELRDYTIPAWRNTRRAPAGGGGREFIDVVTDSVAIRNFGQGWAPLNIAYLDERTELFAFAPERLLVLAADAEDLRLLEDTTIGGLPHARIRATIAGFASTLFLRRNDGLPAMVRYRAAQPNDFGLAPWGLMDVEVWFSRWQTLPPGVSLPLQWDVRRAGVPYKRMTVLSATINPPASPDSFAVSDSLRSAYLATATKPMYDLPMDSARLIEQRFAVFGAFGTPAGAVRLGDRWLLFEAGQAPLVAQRALDWLARNANAPTIAAAFMGTPAQISGGVTWLAAQHIPVYASTGAAPFMRTMLGNGNQPVTGLTVIERGRWLRIGADSLWLESFDLPNARGTLLAYVPSLQWVYAPLAIPPLELDLLMSHVRQRGWSVQRLGTLRNFVQPAPERSANNGTH